MPNEVLNQQNDVAARIAQATLAKRGLDYPGEVRRLLDAGLEVMRRMGTGGRPRVADIVAAAGLSNDAFYRHFASKDALVAAILEDGAVRLHSYLEHQMDKEPTPEGKVRRWVEGVLSQAGDEDIAATTIAVLWNGGTVSSGNGTVATQLAPLLEAPLAALGHADAALDAALLAYGAMGLLQDLLWRQEQPTPGMVEHVVAFCLRK